MCTTPRPEFDYQRWGDNAHVPHQASDWHHGGHAKGTGGAGGGGVLGQEHVGDSRRVELAVFPGE